MSDEKTNLNKSLKLDQSKSKFAPKLEAKQAVEVLEKAAHQVHDQNQSHQQELFEIGRQFLKILTDQTLPEHQGPLSLSLEREAQKKLIDLAIEINLNAQDNQQGLGMGSISLLTLLFRVSILVRNKQNLLEHKLHMLQTKLNKLEEAVYNPSSASK